MTLKTRLIPCLDVKDGRHASPTAPEARERANVRNDAMQVAQ